MYQLLDGKKIAAEIIEQVKRDVSENSVEPQLAVLLVGNDPASHLYVKLKERACKDAGIRFHKYLIDEHEPEEKLIETIRYLNKDADIDAILIQLPLPKQFNQQKILEELDYRKDVDGFHTKNVERYRAGKPQHILPGLSLAIWKLIAAAGENQYAGKQALIIAKSDNFLLPTQKMLTDQGLSVSLARPDDANLIEKTLQADVLVTAIGRPKSITEDMVKDGAVIIDVGVSKVHGKTTGDVDFENVAPKTSFITPVPGGVGPMTIAMLLYNTVQLARLRRKT